MTADMYKNALVTAGVQTQNIVLMPMNVTGTALTGILKAFETSSGTKISEEVKQAANEELVVTSSLGRDSVGPKRPQNLLAWSRPSWPRTKTPAQRKSGKWSLMWPRDEFQPDPGPGGTR